MSGRLSVLSHGTTRLPLEGFSWNFIWVLFFRKSAQEVQFSLNSIKNNGYLIWRFIFMYNNIWLNFFIMRNILEQFVEKIKIQNIYSITFLWKSYRLWDNVEKILYSQRVHRIEYDTEHALCMPDTESYRHTLRICNRYRFFHGNIGYANEPQYYIYTYIACLAEKIVKFNLCDMNYKVS